MLFNLGGFYMKYCSKCGAELHDDAVVCTQCGCQVKEMVPEESSGLGIAAANSLYGHYYKSKQ